MAENVRLKGSTDFSNASYWSAGALAGTQDLRIYEGTDSFDSGTDQSATTFASVIFDSGYGDLSTRIGATTALKLTVSGSVQFLGTFASVNMGGSTIPTLTWDPRNTNARLALAGATVTTAYLDGGSVTMSGTTTCTNLNIGGGDHLIQHHASDTPAIDVAGDARVKLERDWTTLKVSGRAKVTVELRTGVTGGTIEINGDPQECQVIVIGGDHGNITLRSGVLDTSRLIRACTGGTITGRRGATLKAKQTAGAQYTYTNNFVGGGPDVIQV